MSARNLEPITLDVAIDLLSYIGADDRDIWVKVGGILMDTFGDAGFGPWDQWSQSSDRYVEKDARSVWRSLGKNSTPAGIGTLIYLARQGGWNADAQPPERPQTTRKAPPPQRDTAAYAAQLCLAARFNDEYVGTHPYATRKGITWAAGAGRGNASGKLIGKDADCVIVPIRTDAIGKVQGVQCITADGAKQTFGKASGGCLVLGNTLDLGIPWYVCEGWASAVSVVFHHHRGAAVCAASFGKSQLRAAAEILERVFDPPEITILREQD